MTTAPDALAARCYDEELFFVGIRSVAVEI